LLIANCHSVLPMSSSHPVGCKIIVKKIPITPCVVLLWICTVILRVDGNIFRTGIHEKLPLLKSQIQKQEGKERLYSMPMPGNEHVGWIQNVCD